MTSTITREQIDQLPELVRREYPDAWSAIPQVQASLPTIQVELRKMHDQGIDVAPLFFGVEQTVKLAAAQRQGQSTKQAQRN